jgi:protoheme IX farnesyltransferase
MNRLRAYYSALKPERTYANVMTTAAGFLFATGWHFGWKLCVATLLGTTFFVMSACAANNCTDRGIDAQMPRTRKRPTVTGELPVRNLAIVAVALGIVGFGLLAYANWLTVLVGAIAYFDYIVLYGWSKRHSIHSTLIGTICGAAPIVAGYTAVTGRFDLDALLLFLVMVFWQMPHFYAIAIFRREDYAAASLPIWTVVKGVRSAQHWILVYTALYLATVLALAWHETGVVFGVVVGGMAVYWLGLKGLRHQKPEKWARGMFGFSLITLLVLSGALALSPLLS